MKRLSIQINESEEEIKNRARSKALNEGITLREIIIDALKTFLEN